jgi:hypothetical protein
MYPSYKFSHHQHHPAQSFDSLSLLPRLSLLLASSRRLALCGIRREFLGACGSGGGGGGRVWRLGLWAVALVSLAKKGLGWVGVEVDAKVVVVLFDY